MGKLTLHPCKCGGRAKYVSEWGMDDKFVCDSCDYQTPGYYDGAEYAASDWQKRNKPADDGQGQLLFEKRR